MVEHSGSVRPVARAMATAQQIQDGLAEVHGRVLALEAALDGVNFKDVISKVEALTTAFIGRASGQESHAGAGMGTRLNYHAAKGLEPKTARTGQEDKVTRFNEYRP